jgi:hypothetical protein
MVADVLDDDKVDEVLIFRSRSVGGQLHQLQQYHDIATGGLIRKVTTTVTVPTVPPVW